jgi:L-lactate dehydrogenase (cytochrome)
MLSVGLKPGYWYRLLSGPALEYANFKELGPSRMHQTSEFFDPSINWSDIRALRDRWPGNLLIKGPLGPADALLAVEAGVDGLQLSNHGGRQLDRCVPAADLIAPVREVVGPDLPLIVDSGIRTGTDIAIALALGADAVALGRTYLYGLMAGGETGVDHSLAILEREFRLTMHLLGVTSVAELRKRGKDLLVP